MTNSHHDRVDALSLRVLRVLFELAHHGQHAHVGAVARELGIGRTLVASALVRLERAGLARAERARLTMAGLVVAQRLAPMALRSSLILGDPSPAHRSQQTHGTSDLADRAGHWFRATGS